MGTGFREIGARDECGRVPRGVRADVRYDGGAQREESVGQPAAADHRARVAQDWAARAALDPGWAATQIFSSYLGLAMLWYLHGPRFDLRRSLHRQAREFMRQWSIAK